MTTVHDFLAGNVGMQPTTKQTSVMLGWWDH